MTDSLKIAERFGVSHKNVLRAIKKCLTELRDQQKFQMNQNIIESLYTAAPKGREATYLKYDITEFGLAVLLLYINSTQARLVSAEIIYHFFILKNYLSGMSSAQIGAIRGYYRQQLRAKNDL